MNWFSYSRIYYEFTNSYANELIIPWSFARNHSELTFFPTIYYEFTIFIANSLWIHHLRGVFFICYVNLLWIFYFICELTLNSLYVPRINYDFFLYFANEFCIYYLFRGIPLSFSRTHFDFWMSIFVLFWPQIRGNYDQNLNIYRSICISCIYGPDWDFWFQNDLFWPQNDLFWPFWWPWMALNGHFIQAIRISIEFESNHMHIMRIWPCFRFLTPKWSFSTP